jgi:hypothetical protein
VVNLASVTERVLPCRRPCNTAATLVPVGTAFISSSCCPGSYLLGPRDTTNALLGGITGCCRRPSSPSTYQRKGEHVRTPTPQHQLEPAATTLVRVSSNNQKTSEPRGVIF